MVVKLFSGGWGSIAKVTTPYPTKVCHFCNLASIIVPPHPEEHARDNVFDQREASDSQTLPLSTGSEANWYCSRCECWNRYDEKEEGGMRSWENTMADESAHSIQFSSTPKPFMPSSALFGDGGKSIFCHSCRMNQTLVLSMISNYEDDTREQNLQNGQMFDRSRFERWREDLEKRYPPVCVDCRDAVEQRLKKADQRARALIWNDLLQKRHNRKTSQQNRLDSPGLSNEQRTAHETKRNTHDVIAPTNIPTSWYIGGICFTFAWMSEIGVLLCILQKSFASTVSVQIASIVLHYSSATWQPSLPKQINFANLNPGTIHLNIEGLHTWQKTQWTVLAIRILQICQLYLVQGSIWISFISIFIQAVLCAIGHRAIKIHVPPRVSLKSKGAIRSLQGRASHQKNPDLMQLSLQDERSHAQKISKINELQHDPSATTSENSLEYEEEEEVEEGVDDSMDWSPTLPTRDFSSSYTFGPRRFFEPTRDTGLEDLLTRNLGLQEFEKDDKTPMDLDVPVVGEKFSTSTRRGKKPFQVALVTSIVVLILAYLLQMEGFLNRKGRYTYFHSLSIVSQSFSSFLHPFRQWWSSAYSLVHQRSPHQALWRPSFEETARGE